MKNSDWAVFLVVVLAIVVYSHYKQNQPVAGDETTIEYRGERFQLSKPYDSYETYKNDPNNLVASEWPRLQRLLLEAQPGSWFQTDEDWSNAISALEFPGYGAIYCCDSEQADGSTLKMICVEIPHAGKDRIFVGRKTSTGITLVDDFVFAEQVSIESLELNANVLRYRARDGSLLREHELAK
ncbi:MAG TPA: hypothetical protein VFE24_00215 [Pirellulales bacterium]|jgi:hypothetical protein|nr:hypothetical protein [Pirellulales bacterium]